MNDNNYEEDDYPEFPPAKYPLRELITASIFAIIVVWGLAWVIWKVIRWL
jgi:hypothetical protein